MAPVDELRSLKSRVLADLVAAHDYYADTRIAWGVVRDAILNGLTLDVRNLTTGTITTHADLDNKVRGYVAKQLTEATFQQFITIFESFCQDLLRLWLTAYPSSLGEKTLEFRSILELPDADREAITRLVVDKELNEVFYRRIEDWSRYLEDKADLGCPSADEIGRLAEAKATRDVLVHNEGVANRIYAQKAGALARSGDGEEIEVPEDYHRATWELIRKLVAEVSDAAIAKVA